MGRQPDRRSYPLPFAPDLPQARGKVGGCRPMYFVLGGDNPSRDVDIDSYGLEPNLFDRIRTGRAAHVVCTQTHPQLHNMGGGLSPG
jgi:hypothetical protein